jgi:outer membrane protein TolC
MLMAPRSLTFLTAFFLVSAAGAHAQVSLATVVDLAQRNSGAVKIADSNLLKARTQLSQTRDVIIPSVQLSSGLPVFPEIGFTGTPPTIWAVSVNSLVYGIPQQRYISSANYGVKAAEANQKDAREQAALDASLAYIELDAVNANLDSTRQQLEYARRLVQIEQQRAEAGVDPLSDLLQARLSQAQIKLRFEQLSARAAALSKQLSILTGMPNGAILVDHASIPALPAIRGDETARTAPAIDAVRMQARSKNYKASGDRLINLLPQLAFTAQYNRDTTLLNDVNNYFAKPLPANNFSSGIAIQFPLFDMSARAKARESAADALQAKIEAEEAQRKNDLQIETLNGSLRQLNAMAEIASLKQQIAAEQLKSVLAQLELGSGAGSSSSSNSSPQPELSPKAEQLARIDERQKIQDSADAALELAKAKLNLLRSLGHIEDWLRLLRAN